MGLPTEYGTVNDEDADMAKKVLDDAALTYVQALPQVLYVAFLLPACGGLKTSSVPGALPARRPTPSPPAAGLSELSGPSQPRHRTQRQHASKPRNDA